MPPAESTSGRCPARSTPTAPSGAQLAASNVVVLYASHGKTDIVEDTLGNTAIQIGLAGERECLLLRDGQAWQGTWRWQAPLEAATIGTGDTVIVPGFRRPFRLLRPPTARRSP